jgi:magnesium transporter
MNEDRFNSLISQISRDSKKRLDVFSSVKYQDQRNIIMNLSRYVQHDIINKLDNQAIVDLLQNLDTDEASDIIRLLPLKKQKEIVSNLNESLKLKISSLLSFDPDTAMSLININYIQVEHNDTIVSVAKQVKTHERRSGKLPVILVMEKHKLLGVLPGHALGLAQPEDLSKNFVKKVKTVRESVGTDKILEIFKKNPRSKIVVLSEKRHVLGFIYSDDVLRLLHEKEALSLYDFAGVNQEESVFDSTKTKVKFRHKWLIINLGTAFLASFAVSFFDEIIAQYVILAVYMPIVAGMGGNSANQTLAVVVRGISLKQVNFKTIFRTLKNELGASLINGLINGLLVASIVFLKDNNIYLALILASAMIINLLVAAFFGTIIPLIMKHFGKDPASSATIFITTATDILGFIAFLGLATLIL